MATKQKPIDYQALQAELEQIVTSLQQPELDIDVALKQYEQGLTIIKQLETYLSEAENKVVELKAKFSS